MREGMYVSVMCTWTGACLFATMDIRSVLPSLRPVIVFHLAWLPFLAFCAYENTNRNFYGKP